MLKANRGTKTQKHKSEPNQRHMTQGNKEKEAEKLGLGFLGWNMCAHTWAYVCELVACVRILQACVHIQNYACADTPPETLTQKLKNT